MAIFGKDTIGSQDLIIASGGENISYGSYPNRAFTRSYQNR